MNDQAFNQLNLQEKAALVQKQGTFIEAEDFYSFKIYLYSVDQHRAEVTIDYSGNIIDVEFVEKKHESDIPHQLDSSLGNMLD
jgi:hypothetical protein